MKEKPFDVDKYVASLPQTLDPDLVIREENRIDALIRECGIELPTIPKFDPDAILWPESILRDRCEKVNVKKKREKPKKKEKTNPPITHITPITTTTTTTDSNIDKIVSSIDDRDYVVGVYFIENGDRILIMFKRISPEVAQLYLCFNGIRYTLMDFLWYCSNIIEDKYEPESSHYFQFVNTRFLANLRKMLSIDECTKIEIWVNNTIKDIKEEHKFDGYNVDHYVHNARLYICELCRCTNNRYNTFRMSNHVQMRSCGSRFHCSRNKHHRIGSTYYITEYTAPGI